MPSISRGEKSDILLYRPHLIVLRTCPARIDGGLADGVPNDKVFLWDAEEENFVDSGHVSEAVAGRGRGQGVISGDFAVGRCWRSL